MHIHSKYAIKVSIYEKCTLQRTYTYSVLSHSLVSDSATPWTVTHQAPLSMGILQERILECVAVSYILYTICSMLP